LKHYPVILSIVIAAVIIVGGLMVRVHNGKNASAAASDGSTATTSDTAHSAAAMRTLTIMMGGDVMFDRGIRKLGEASGYDGLLAPVADLFARADIATVNLEGPITGNASRTLFNDGSTGRELTFTFATATAAVLARAHVTAVSLANNHTANFGQPGFEETEQWLDAAGLAHFGDPWNGTSTEVVFDKNGIKVAFVGYHAFAPGLNGIVTDVRRLASEGYFVIVMPHWGDEYSASSTPLQRGVARDLVDAGAGAIVGSHPHVIEPHEWLQSAAATSTGTLLRHVPVFYSLGNLLFDQYFSPAVMAGNIVEIDLERTGTTTRLTGAKLYDTSTASRAGTTVDPVPHFVANEGESY